MYEFISYIYYYLTMRMSSEYNRLTSVTVHKMTSQLQYFHNNKWHTELVLCPEYYGLFIQVKLCFYLNIVQTMIRVPMMIFSLYIYIYKT